LNFTCLFDARLYEDADTWRMLEREGSDGTLSATAGPVMERDRFSDRVVLVESIYEEV